MKIGVDNRLFERIDGQLGVRYSPQGSDREYCTTSKNISGGGIRMSLLKKLEPGTKLDLEIFKHSTDMRVRCRGRIAWVWNEPMNEKEGQLFEAGIEFMNTKLLYLGYLIAYLRAQNEQSDLL